MLWLHSRGMVKTVCGPLAPGAVGERHVVERPTQPECAPASVFLPGAYTRLPLLRRKRVEGWNVRPFVAAAFYSIDLFPFPFVAPCIAKLESQSHKKRLVVLDIGGSREWLVRGH